MRQRGRRPGVARVEGVVPEARGDEDTLWHRSPREDDRLVIAHAQRMQHIPIDTRHFPAVRADPSVGGRSREQVAHMRCCRDEYRARRGKQCRQRVGDRRPACHVEAAVAPAKAHVTFIRRDRKTGAERTELINRQDQSGMPAREQHADHKPRNGAARAPLMRRSLRCRRRARHPLTATQQRRRECGGACGFDESVAHQGPTTRSASLQPTTPSWLSRRRAPARQPAQSDRRMTLQKLIRRN